jgi:hypothetical protein
MSPEPAFPGTDLVETAFAEGYLGGLGAAMAQLQRTEGRPVVVTLVAGIRPWRWAETRAAVGALREQGAVALPAAPVVAAWVVLSAGGAQQPGEQYAVHDALLALADLHPEGRHRGHGSADAMAARIARFFDEAVGPHLLALFAQPAQVWHRGLVGYFSRHPASPDLLARALQTLVDRDDPAPAGEERWFEYTRAEALSLLGRIGPSVELAQLERLWQADAATRTGDCGEDGDPLDDQPDG